MTGTGTITKIWLSGAMFTALLLAFFAVQAFGTTEVYNVPARFTTHTAGQSSSLTQYFRMTCDSVLSVSFFNGWYPGQGTFWAELRDSASGALAWSGSRNTADSLKYKDVGFTVNAGVTRGKTYKLIIGFTYGFIGYNYYLDVYYDTTNVYRYGKMYLYGDSVDLCARVVGTGKVIDVWGLNTYLANTADLPTTPIDTMLGLCKAEGVTFMREQVPWRSIQPDSAHPDSFNWARTDTLMQMAAARNLNIMWGFWGCAKFASTKPDTDTCIVDHQNEFWTHPPKGLQRPVFVNGLINPDNYFGYYAYKTVERYGNGGSHTYGHPIQYWEIWNEENATAEWDYPNRADTSVGYPWVTDSLKLIALYDTLVHVAYQAIKGRDSNAKIVMGAMHNTFATWKRWDKCSSDSVTEAFPGVWWLDKFLENGAGQWVDAYAFHPYQQTPTNGRVQMALLKQAVDTLRQVLRNRGQGNKPLWANEVGWAASHLWGTEQKQADAFVQFHGAAIEQGANPKGQLDNLMWYELQNWWSYDDPLHTNDTSSFYGYCGTVLKDTQAPKPMHYAFKQMSGKLKDKYFNRRVPLPDTNVYCYEFQVPGADTSKKTWVVWRTAGQDTVYLPSRTAHFSRIQIAYDPYPDSVYWTAEPAGFAKMAVDTAPLYCKESNSESSSRPDIIVDSLYTYPTTPRAGDYVFFYARLKNIGNATLNANVGNAVKFQVDGVTKATYTDSRAIMKDSTIIVGYNPWPPPGDGSIYDWYATWGDHLIRAWADSADRYVELREDNNTKYLWKHFQPKVSVIINNNDKFTNHLTNNNLHIVMNESTTPLPDSAKLKHQGTWMKIGVYGSRDTAVSYSGNGIKYDSVKVWQSGDTANAGDTIIVDITAPRAQITSPAHGATVSGTINISGYAYDYGPTHFLVDTLRYFRNSIYHDTIHVSLVNIYGGVLGTWNTVPVPNGWTRDTLVVRDSAGNVSRDSISLNVYNKLQLRGGEGFATDFGIYPSSPMNVATDPGGNVYIAETQGSKIRKHSPRKDSLFAFSAKRGNDSTGTSWATSMTLRDSETIWIADGYNHCIKRFDRQGNLILRFGSFGTDTSRFKQPCGIALDNKGRLWVSDRLNNRIQVFDSTGHFLFQFGSQGRDSTQFDSPTGITITGKDTLLGIVQDLVWISDTRNNRIQVYQIDTVSLAVRFFKTISQVDSSGLDTPLGICSDKWGDVFVADSRHNRIVELNPYGERILDFGGLGDSLCQFRTPVGVAASPGAHYLYVADMGNRRVQRFTVILEDSSGGGPQSGGIVQRIPLVYSLAQSHPNPTTGEALIEYGLPQESPVRLVVYNVAGQVVREYKPGKQEAGFYSYKWDGRSNLGHRVGAGVYFYRLRAGSWTKTRNMVVIR